MGWEPASLPLEGDSQRGIVIACDLNGPGGKQHWDAIDDGIAARAGSAANEIGVADEGAMAGWTSEQAEVFGLECGLEIVCGHASAQVYG